MRINLAHDTIDKSDIDTLIEWLKQYPQLTKGEMTLAFEKKFAEYIGCKHAVYVNSGSSANLLMLSVLKSRTKNNKVIVPILSWATDVAPILQLGFEPIFIGCDSNLLPDSIQLLRAIEEHNPAAFLCVSPLGIPPNMSQIKDLCESFGLFLLEDNCESLGASYDGTKLGNFGIMSSFSFYFSHHISTIEGGMITTNSDIIRDSLVCQRSHGWLRDLDIYPQMEQKLGLKAKYTFMQAGYNLRATDLQAFIGLGQMDKLPSIVEKRNKNFTLFNNLTKDKNRLKLIECEKSPKHGLSSFAMPLGLLEHYQEFSNELKSKDIDHRPMICGDISQQPFVLKAGNFVNYATDLQKRLLDSESIYLPNHTGLTEDDIYYMADVFNNYNFRR